MSSLFESTLGKATVAFGVVTVLAVGYGIFGPEKPAAGFEAQAQTASGDVPALDAGVDYGLEITIAGQANGTVTLDLFEDIAPLHTAQLVALAEAGAYDNVVFHRVIDKFMAQTGDVQFGQQGGANFSMQMAGRGGSQYPDIKAEFSKEPFDPGVVGMARSQDPDSANSQFFIMFDAGHFLNEQYTVVGKVTAGFDVVGQIKRGDGPNGAVLGEPDIMTSVKVTKN